MYMHQFSQVSSPRFPKFIVGHVYHVHGYHTGDFTGRCVEVGLNEVTFEVSKLKIAVQLDSARGAGVKISAA